MQTLVTCELMKVSDDKCKKKRGWKTNFVLFIVTQSQFACVLDALQEKIKIAKSRVTILSHILSYNTTVCCLSCCLLVYIIVKIIYNIYSVKKKKKKEKNNSCLLDFLLLAFIMRVMWLRRTRTGKSWQEWIKAIKECLLFSLFYSPYTWGSSTELY